MVRRKTVTCCRFVRGGFGPSDLCAFLVVGATEKAHGAKPYPARLPLHGHVDNVKENVQDTRN